MVNVVIEKIIGFLSTRKTRRITVRQLNALFRAYMLTGDEQNEVIAFCIKNGIIIDPEEGGFILEQEIEAIREAIARQKLDEKQQKALDQKIAEIRQKKEAEYKLSVEQRKKEAERKRTEEQRKKTAEKNNIAEQHKKEHKPGERNIR